VASRRLIFEAAAGSAGAAEGPGPRAEAAPTH
jgi:hypothetical protein